MWIARDKLIGSRIKVYKDKPIFKGYYFDSPEGCVCELPKELFPNFTFEDSPKQLILK